MCRRSRIAPPAINAANDLAVERPISTKRRLPENLAHLMWRCPFLNYGLCNTVLSEDLHCSLVDDMCFRQDGSAGVTLEEHMLNAEHGEEDGEIKPARLVKVSAFQYIRAALTEYVLTSTSDNDHRHFYNFSHFL
jgi:hypothetical protein